MHTLIQDCKSAVNIGISGAIAHIRIVVRYGLTAETISLGPLWCSILINYSYCRQI